MVFGGSNDLVVVQASSLEPTWFEPKWQRTDYDANNYDNDYDDDDYGDDNYLFMMNMMMIMMKMMRIKLKIMAWMMTIMEMIMMMTMIMMMIKLIYLYPHGEFIDTNLNASIKSSGLQPSSRMPVKSLLQVASICGRLRADLVGVLIEETNSPVHQRFEQRKASALQPRFELQAVAQNSYNF